ncbi:Hypothetical predicted protein, partial [Paramuricea clavata]
MAEEVGSFSFDSINSDGYSINLNENEAVESTIDSSKERRDGANCKNGNDKPIKTIWYADKT